MQSYPDFWLLPFLAHPPSSLHYRPHSISPQSTQWPHWHLQMASGNFPHKDQQSPPSQLRAQYFLTTNARLAFAPGPLHFVPLQCRDHGSLQRASLLLWSQHLPPPKRSPSPQLQQEFPGKLQATPVRKLGKLTHIFTSAFSLLHTISQSRPHLCSRTPSRYSPFPCPHFQLITVSSSNFLLPTHHNIQDKERVLKAAGKKTT